MYTISKKISFSASHVLAGLSADHPCSRLHGHNYELTVHLRSATLNETGFVRDYRDLDELKKYVDEHLDHRHLNDIFAFNPTAENIAHHLYELFKSDFPELYAIEVCETPKTSAIYAADGQ